LFLRVPEKYEGQLFSPSPDLSTLLIDPRAPKNMRVNFSLLQQPLKVDLSTFLIGSRIWVHNIICSIEKISGGGRGLKLHLFLATFEMSLGEK
jgi:hypothetical protein